MRVCIITSDIDALVKNKDRLEKVVSNFTELELVEEIYVTGYSWPSKILSKAKIYPFKSRSKLKVKISCFTLKNIDKYIWIPTPLAVPALWLMRGEFVDTVASFDPDVIISTELRWQKELEYFMEKIFRGFIHSSDKNSIGIKFQIHRNYNPSIKVSIVLPTYNGSRYIKKSIDSCLNQTHKNIELIVVDDASTDTTPEIISSYTDKRIRYLRNEKNMKLSKSLNVGFAHANGEFLTWTSDDNYYDSEAIKTMLSILCTYSKFEFVYAGQYAIDENDNILRHNEVRPLESLKVSNPIGGCFLYTRKVAETIGKYSPDAFLAEDLDYWIRVFRRFHIVGLRKPLYYYRYHKDSLTSKYALGEVAKVADSIRKNHNLFAVK
jgi:GT2 family glycosyltransferase